MEIANHVVAFGIAGVAAGLLLLLYWALPKFDDWNRRRRERNEWKRAIVANWPRGRG